MALRKHGAGGAGRRRVFVVDDHPVLREGLAQIINRQSDLEVCGFAETAAAALDGISTASPDLVIVDISLKGGDGLGLIGELRRRDPGLHLLVLSMHDELLYAERVLRIGAAGYVMKEEAPERLVIAIRHVLEGGTYLSDRMRTRLRRSSAGGVVRPNPSSTRRRKVGPERRS